MPVAENVTKTSEFIQAENLITNFTESKHYLQFADSLNNLTNAIENQITFDDLPTTASWLADAVDQTFDSEVSFYYNY